MDWGVLGLRRRVRHGRIPLRIEPRQPLMKLSIKIERGDNHISVTNEIDDDHFEELTIDALEDIMKGMVTVLCLEKTERKIKALAAALGS